MKSNTIRRLAAAAVFSAAVCLSGCSSGKSSSEKETASTTEASASSTAASAASSETTAATEETTSEAEAATVGAKFKRVPDVPVNVSGEIDFSVVKFNGAELSIDNVTVDSFIKTFGLADEPGSVNHSGDEFSFTGCSYELDNDSEKMSSHLAVEAVNSNGDIIPCGTLMKADLTECRVIGVKVSNFFTKQDKAVFANGLEIGMSKDDMKALLGEPEKVGFNCAYNNGKYTAVISFMGDEADEIYILKNE